MNRQAVGAGDFDFHGTGGYTTSSSAATIPAKGASSRATRRRDVGLFMRLFLFVLLTTFKFQELPPLTSAPTGKYSLPFSGW